ncbi:phosphatase PAP2 family protein [Saprospiraceae bacterium]|nr:phosphatase PAP2 family protein [Saprospiraceae bacterium]
MIETISEIDLSLFHAINAGADIPVFTDILITFRNKLLWIPFYIFILTFIIANYGQKKWFVIFFLIMTVVITDTISSQLIKKNTQRLRPCNTEEVKAVSRIHCGHGYSFPSSHASNHFGIATFLFLLFSWVFYRSLLFLWAGIISFAQIYVGVHYPSDVIAGAMLGIILGYISYRIFDSLAQILFKEETEIHVI